MRTCRPRRRLGPFRGIRVLPVEHVRSNAWQLKVRKCSSVLCFVCIEIEIISHFILCLYDLNLQNENATVVFFRKKEKGKGELSKENVELIFLPVDMFIRIFILI